MSFSLMVLGPIKSDNKLYFLTTKFIGSQSQVGYQFYNPLSLHHLSYRSLQPLLTKLSLSRFIKSLAEDWFGLIQQQSIRINPRDPIQFSTAFPQLDSSSTTHHSFKCFQFVKFLFRNFDLPARKNKAQFNLNDSPCTQFRLIVQLSY